MLKKFLLVVNFLVFINYVLSNEIDDNFNSTLKADAAYGCNNPSLPNACTTGGTVKCLNFQTDNNNCGSCGNVCPLGVTCSSGTCGSCPITGNIFCNGACISTSSSNCGTCGNTCSSTQFCSGTGSSAVCTSLGYTVNGCTTDASTGTGETTADQPITVLVSGTQSIQVSQCHQYCNQISTNNPTFFTLYTDTFGTGTAGTTSSINTYCSCYYTTGPFDIATVGTCTTNGYGTTSNGVGSWEVYSIP